MKNKIRNVYIDSNIWLSLYSFSKTDLENFSQIEALMGKKINLIIPIQTRDEIYRNRENKFKDSLDKFKLQQISFPIYCKFYEKYSDIKKKYDELKKDLDDWSKEIENDVINHTIFADKIIANIFDRVNYISIDEEIVSLAEKRYKRGNPPGKNNSFGDAINWECLLKTIPNGEDLYFVSEDTDYCSVLDKDRMNSFLLDEWKKTKQSSIFFYSSLKSFLQECLKEIEIENDDETIKNDLIQGLIHSMNFSVTHNIISSLSSYSSFNDIQIKNLCFAVLTNTQVEWILDDPDVKQFYARILGINDAEVNVDVIAKRYRQKKLEELI